MAIKSRAIAVEDKEVRRHAILDAAETLFLEHPSRIANVAEVAVAAGLGKGTVYLYFPSKEEMLLSLHERHVERFFAALIARLGSATVTYEQILEVTHKHLVRVPGYLPLTSRCFGMMDRDIPTDVALAFKMRVGAWLTTAGAALERHFPQLAPGDGVTLLQHSYGLIVGLWQLLHPIKRFGKALQRADLRLFDRDYEKELDLALYSLWIGWIEGAPRTRTVAPSKGKPHSARSKAGRA
jgi:AcrR family transcriptional regulator